MSYDRARELEAVHEALASFRTSDNDNEETFPAADELRRYIEHGTGLGYLHGQRIKRVTPCGLHVWPDDEGPREAMRGQAVTCPRCIAAMRGGR